MKKFTFKQMTKQELEDMFGLKRVRNHIVLENWISAQETISEIENIIISNLKESLIDRIEDWNEQELIMKFIGPLIALVNFDTDNFCVFAGRTISAVIGEYELSGTVDAMIAKGRQIPKKPYFCLNEYKKEQGTENDPAGQALAAMLVAQHLNEDRQPVYGAYVVGRNWFFMVLHENEYSISNAYMATREQIFDIAGILKKLKQIIFELANQGT